ncbi:MAG: NAD(P)/FAD-dependent oxidoreductase [Burkholderiaceae bacterium]|nr:NAD(P)/FAD-dependent oxidoreductase [Burkholderiaceae bacterium]
MGTDRFDAVIVGAGAAGLMCAAVAGQRGRRVLLVDHGDAPGRKILISGGGRCNFTNLQTAATHFISANPRFATSALRRYRPDDFIALVERHRIAWHEKTLGQLFCDGSAKQIVRMLLDECAAGAVEIGLGDPVAGIERRGADFEIRIGSRVAISSALVIATGGLSIPKLGATDFGYALARRFGLKIVEPRPALVPLKLAETESIFKGLSGVSAPVVARAGGQAFRESALFTHRGLSGPAILQASSYWRHRMPLEIDFLPDRSAGWLRQAKRARPKATLASVLADDLPSRLAEVLAARVDLRGELANLSDKTLDEAAAQLASWRFEPSGTEGFAKAEVTAGGIDTAGLSSKTMAASAVPGLYAIGEVVDVTGWLGGYNFQWAWASAHAAGRAL